MSEQTPYELLGVKDGASFDEIQEARNRLMEKIDESDGKQVEAIEAAYDAVLMHRLKMRQEGKIKVPERIRFPERSVPAPAPSEPAVLSKLPSWMQDLADQPEPKDIWVPAGITLALIGLTLFYLGNATDPAALQLPLAVGWGSAIYFINRKEGRFGRAVLMSFLGLLGGLIIGLLVALLIPEAMLASIALGQAQVSAIFSLIVLWGVSSFLK